MIDNANKPFCKHCGSYALIKDGTSRGKQYYWCKYCLRRVKADDMALQMKTPTREVSSALNMYYEGMSINAIQRYLKQEYCHAPSTATIFEWMQKYTQYLTDSIKNYHPKVGDVWVADETVLKIDGNDVWLWDIIDAKTRFLLASRLSRSRTTGDAQMLINKAVKVAGKNPKTVLTDRLKSYLDVYYGDDAEHKQVSPFIKGGDNTNLIERFHGTLKQRTKVMRGLKNFESALDFTDGFLAYYNFLRPHHSLNNKTPATMAGIDYSYKNWADVIRKYRPSTPIRVLHTERTAVKMRETHIGRPHTHKRKRKTNSNSVTEIASLRGEVRAN